MEHTESSRHDDARASKASGEALSYASAFHAPVLCHTVLEALVTDRAGLYVDATLGGGGHSAALLDALAPEGRVIGIDQDAEALATAAARLASHTEHGRFRTLHGNFGAMARCASSHTHHPLGEPSRQDDARATEADAVTDFQFSSKFIGNESAYVIPEWIKNVGDYWCNGHIDDKDFVNAMQYLIKNEIMELKNGNT